MKFLVLAILLVVLQASTPPQTGNKSREQGQQDTDSRKNVTSSAPSHAAPDSPDKNASGTKDKSQNDEVKVGALPDKIRVQSIKDTVDWTILGCTIVLTIVGVAGTIVALRTLKAIEEQARIMGQHKVSLEQLADTAAKNTATTERILKLSEQAEVMLDRAEIHGLTGAGFNDACWLKLTVKNCGRTKAENVVGDFKLLVNNNVRDSITNKPTDLGAGQAHDITFPRFKNVVFPTPLFSDVLTGKAEMTFYGVYNYNDLFGGSYTRQCLGTFHPESNTFTIDQRT